MAAAAEPLITASFSAASSAQGMRWEGCQRSSCQRALTLNQGGTLSGTPRSTGRYLFLVQAIDQAQNRSTISALSLNVAATVATPSTPGRNCQPA